MFKKSEVFDLNISVEDALQYIISCGVVVAQHQWLTAESKAKLAAKAAAAWALDENGSPRPGSPAAAAAHLPRQER